MVEMRKRAQPLIDDVKKLIFGIRLESINVFEFAGRYKLLNEKVKQFDAYVTGRATTKLMQAVSKVGRRNHYDMVLRKKDVIMYRNRITIADITSLIKAEIKDSWIQLLSATVSSVRVLKNTS